MNRRNFAARIAAALAGMLGLGAAKREDDDVLMISGIVELIEEGRADVAAGRTRNWREICGETFTFNPTNRTGTIGADITWTELR